MERKEIKVENDKEMESDQHSKMIEPIKLYPQLSKGSNKVKRMLRLWLVLFITFSFFQIKI